MLLLEDLYHGNKFGKAVSDAVLSILKQQQINHKIPYRLAGKAVVAHKTGEDAGTTHDVGIVYAETPFLIGFASNKVDVNDMEDAIQDISRHLYSRNTFKQ
jgi:beta-lactamase class A